jgi:hypothetical protein
MANLATAEKAGGPGANDRAAAGGAVRERVVAALGLPPGLFQLAVYPLWGAYFRVNVLVGPDAASVRVAHSYFVEAAGNGDIVTSTPPIVRLYP